MTEQNEPKPFWIIQHSGRGSPLLHGPYYTLTDMARNLKKLLDATADTLNVLRQVDVDRPALLGALRGLEESVEAQLQKQFGKE